MIPFKDEGDPQKEKIFAEISHPEEEGDLADIKSSLVNESEIIPASNGHEIERIFLFSVTEVVTSGDGMDRARHSHIHVLTLSESPCASGCQTPELYHIRISLLHCFINIDSIRTNTSALAKEFSCSRSTGRSDGMRTGEN
ncbi:hypothetical protein MJG53_006075 [Ovis ammon polii x Ovis aries]|uniref:Uncharacterized protein n=1 Tax=Ovis ammon polii x Ovis aries TaxID=2918886 RepID=A0ACB9V7D5_9CETA|nr:hypothetical protein MJG53_006075 [Ovis ammon polii x Ovis aries]